MHATLISGSAVWFAIFNVVESIFCRTTAALQGCSCCRAVSVWVSVTFVYCVETVKDMAIVAMECE